MKKSDYYIYIVSNKRLTVFYTGITSDLIRRIGQHKQKIIEGFTKKYNVDQLLYFERFDDPVSAIEREKQIKAWRREKKLNLIKTSNSVFEDLYDTLM